MLVKIFGLVLAAGAFGISLAMMIMGGRWQRIEMAGYGGVRRPWWFYAISLGLIGFYVIALVSFIGGEKTWGGWGVMVFIPVVWAIKGIVLVFNPKGRKVVSSILGNEGWIKVGLARLPVAIILGVFALFA